MADVRRAEESERGERGPGTRPGEHDWAGTLARAPDLLEPGLEVLETGVELTPGVVVDLMAKDARSRPVLVLVAAAAQAEDLLGRALLVLAEVDRLKGLLERAYRREGLAFREGVRVHLVAPRLSDRFHAALQRLEPGLVRATETGGMRLPAEPRRAPAPPPVTARPEPLSAIPAPRSPPENGREVEKLAVPPPEPAAQKSTALASPGAPSLLDETKRKILRVSDEVEEEVDGDLVRFLVRNRVLAVLSGGSQDFSVYVGDQLDRRRRIRSVEDLNQTLDDIYRRYFFLLRAAPGAKS